MKRRGFTLVELIMAVVVSGLVMGLAISTLVAQRRTWWEQMWRTDGHATLRAAQLIVGREIRGAVPRPGVSGIVRVQPSRLTLRAGRQLRFVCARADPSDSVLVVVGGYRGVREINPRVDSLMVFVAESSGQDDWVARGVRGVSAGVSCEDGSGGVRLSLTGPVGVPAAVGTPLRAFETVELRAYRSGPGWWLGIRRAGTDGSWPVIQPLLGPIAPGGVDFVASRRGGPVPTGLAPSVLSVTVRVPSPSGRRDPGVRLEFRPRGIR